MPDYDKYAEHQDFHWRAYRGGGIYSDHARKVREWIGEHRVLDVGGGDGLIAALLQQKGHEVMVVDDNALAVGYATRHGVPAQLGSAYATSGRWDAVYCGDTLEHLEWPRSALRRFRRVTDVLYVATPPRTGGLRDHRHTQEWTPAELTRLLRRCGWQETSSEVANERILSRSVKRPAWWRRCLSAGFRSS